MFDEPTEEIAILQHAQKIESKIKVSIQELDFRYGSVVFKYEIPTITRLVEFEIENLQIRPEFEVLKDKTQLKSQLKTIDEQLSIIRNKGRQTFLDIKPENFRRILHDYSDTQKGFVICKDLLEETIT